MASGTDILLVRFSDGGLLQFFKLYTKCKDFLFSNNSQITQKEISRATLLPKYLWKIAIFNNSFLTSGTPLAFNRPITLRQSFLETIESLIRLLQSNKGESVNASFMLLPGKGALNQTNLKLKNAAYNTMYAGLHLT